MKNVFQQMKILIVKSYTKSKEKFLILSKIGPKNMSKHNIKNKEVKPMHFFITGEGDCQKPNLIRTIY